MKLIILIQVITGILLSISILMQNKGSGLGGAFGGDFGGYYTKRGLEKFLAKTSVVLSIVFILLSALNVFVFQY